MKNTLSLFLLCALLSSAFVFAAGEKGEKPIQISGKINNPSSDSILISDPKGKHIKSVKLDKNQSFKMQLNLPDGFYHIGDGNEHTEIYLSGGFNLQLSLHTDSFDESIQYTGKGAVENNYLAARYLLNEQLEAVSAYNYYGLLDEKAFLHLCDSIADLHVSLLQKKSKNMLPLFKQLAAQTIRFEKLDRIDYYPQMHRYMLGLDSFELSASYPDPIRDFNVNSEAYLCIPAYESLLRSFISKKTQAIFEKQADADYNIGYIDVVVAEIQNQAVRENLLMPFAESRLVYAKDLNGMFAKLKEIIQTPSALESLESTYQKILKIQKGNPSPDFRLADANGQLYELKDFKGKFVYIDVWATWCGPCMAEMPAMAKLQDSLQNQDIVFVGICVWDDKKNWEHMLKGTTLHGLQLFAPNFEMDFLKAYLISGIPRFILLDRQGNILDADAKRPSDPLLIPELFKWLQH